MRNNNNNKKKKTPNVSQLPSFLLLLIDTTLFSDARDVGGAGIDHGTIAPNPNPPSNIVPQGQKNVLLEVEATTTR